MRKLPFLIGAAVALASAAFAADDPITTRQILMDNNGAAAGLAAAVMKDEIAYNPTIGKAVIQAFAATAHAYGHFFPEGSVDPATSAASPKIWEDAAGFQAELQKFLASADAAVEASGRAGPADKEAFTAAVQPILGSCRSCHEGYRLEN